MAWSTGNFCSRSAHPWPSRTAATLGRAVAPRGAARPGTPCLGPARPSPATHLMTPWRYHIVLLLKFHIECTKNHVSGPLGRWAMTRFTVYYTTIYYTIIYYTILYSTILYYTVLYYTVLYSIVLYYTILCYATQLCYTRLCCIIPCYMILQCTVLYFIILWIIYYTLL